MQYSKEESKAIWNQNAEFWDCAMGDESNDFHREVVRPKVTELLNVQWGMNQMIFTEKLSAPK